MKYIIAFFTLLISFSASAEYNRGNSISIRFGDVGISWEVPYNQYYRMPVQIKPKHRHHEFYDRHGHGNPNNWYHKKYKQPKSYRYDYYDQKHTNKQLKKAIRKHNKKYHKRREYHQEHRRWD